MRAKAAVLVVLVVGMTWAANTIIRDRPLSPVQLEKVKTVCPDCHGDVPEYDRVAKVHGKHAAFNCSFCHRDQSGLKTTDSVHAGVQRVGLGALLLAVLGIMGNGLITSGRVKAN